jgi:hypothetical protein
LTISTGADIEENLLRESSKLAKWRTVTPSEHPTPLVLCYFAAIMNLMARSDRQIVNKIKGAARSFHTSFRMNKQKLEYEFAIYI